MDRDDRREDPQKETEATKETESLAEKITEDPKKEEALHSVIDALKSEKDLLAHNQKVAQIDTSAFYAEMAKDPDAKELEQQIERMKEREIER